MKFIVKNILFLFNLFFIAGLVFGYVSPLVNPNFFWPLAFFGLTFKFWLIANILLLLFWLLIKRSLWVYNLVVILLGSPIILRDIQFNSSSPNDDDMKVMFFNTRVLQVYNDGNTSDQLNDYLIEQDLDIVVMVEWLNKKGHIDQNSYPHQQFVRLESARNRYDYGLILASKYKILHWERINYGHVSNNLTAFFDLEVGDEVIRVVATHLQSNSLAAGDYHKFLDFDFDDESTNHAKTVATQLRWSMQRRAYQTQRILNLIKESPYPVLIMGDFNDTPQSYAYQQLKNGRKDAFIERGSGLGASYLEPFPVLRIDYILYDKQLECTSYSSNTDILSDHKMIRANFKKTWNL